MMFKVFKFSLNQCAKSDVEIKEIEIISYASTAGSLMFAVMYKTRYRLCWGNVR